MKLETHKYQLDQVYHFLRQAKLIMEQLELTNYKIEGDFKGIFAYLEYIQGENNVCRSECDN